MSRSFIVRYPAMFRPLIISAICAFSISALPAVPSSDRDGFEKIVVPFLDKYCMDCHDADTQKGQLSLEDIDPDIIKGEDLEIWRMLRDQVHFRDMPPEDKKQPAEGEREAVLKWVRGELLKGQRPDAVSEEKLALPQFGNYVDHLFLFDKRLPHVYPAPPRIWRLRPSIYNTVMPRMGENISGLANGLSYLDGPVIKDYASVYFVDEASTSPLLGNAKKVADALVGQRSKDKVFKELVAESTPQEETVRSAIEHAFRKILGRKPSGEESERFFAFYGKAKATGGHLNAGKALLTAVLMQPEFLFRSELGDGEPDEFGRVRLSGREVAYALSYALGNMPNDTFVRAAGEGKFASQEGVAAAVAAQLQDDSEGYSKNPRVFQFFREYFDYPNAGEVFKDAPPGGQHDAGRLVADLEMTMAEILRADEDVLARLLTTRDFYVNTQYGRKQTAGQLIPRHEKRGKYHTAFNLPPDWRWSAEVQPVSFRPDERAGVLTHPAWLAAWSGNFDNHPVQRGKWVRTHLLGGSVPDVPIGVDARVPEMEHKSFRQRLEMTTSASECWRCHKNMDPIGVAFERYDHYGRYQRKDAGQPVDARARIDRTYFPELHRDFSGPTEMMDFLSKSDRATQVFVRHAFRFFMGRNETLGDANTLQDAFKAYKNSGGSFNALVTSLLSSDSFLLRQVKPPSS